MARRSTTSCGIVCSAVAILFAASFPATAQPVTIADTVVEQIETPHPYREGWSTVIHHPGASYIAVHFERFELAPGDRLELTDPNGTYLHTYTGRGFEERGGDFWGLSILGDTMIVTLRAQQSADNDKFGVLIDRWTHGFPNVDPGPDAVCGTKDFKDVECYRSSFPTEFSKSRAVVRLIKNGAAHCTGWLASCQNHIITNQHCVGSQAELNQIEFQFDYKTPNCGSGTATVALQLQGGTLLESDAPLDYALITPALAGNDPQATYGFLQWDKDRLPSIDERIYIPGHPSGVPKIIALESTDTVHDQSGKCEVYSTNEPACQTSGPPDVGYYCDTEGGSSGSPVISGNTHKVVALHHCASCPNRGVPIKNVYAAIQSSAHPLPGCSVCDPGAAATNLNSSVPGNNRIDLSWTAAAGATQYRVYRSVTGCDTGLTQVGTSAVASYNDTQVSGGRTYYYRVTAINSCGAESAQSNCTSKQATGVCLDPPAFGGLVSATNLRSSQCTVDLAWNAATPQCGSAVRYNIYRSLIPGFAPTAATRIASCVSGASYRDNGIDSGLPYYYVVRAEDNVATGSGPCNSGNEDLNTLQQSATPSGPDNLLFSAGFETTTGWTLEGEWQIGAPQGRGGTAAGGSGTADPTVAYSGSGVLGNDLTGSGTSLGNYEDSIAASQYATGPSFNTVGHPTTFVRYRRWLGVEKNSYDLASLEGFNGSTWSTLWSNPNTDVNDGTWVLQEFDASATLAGKSAARLRFSIRSDSSVHFCGWNVDALDVYEPGVCVAGPAHVHPVPDGKWAPGAPMRARRAGSGGPDDVIVTWDTTQCADEIYHLLYGNSDNLSSYRYDGAACLLPVTGTATVAIPKPAAGKATWWLMVGVQGFTEAAHGYRSNGTPRPAQGAGLCGILSQNGSATCP
ncbi:MAG: trypsin-like peptidase domain-containing protein [Acidobacteriota bacterium]